jgi:hypothetical protein
MYGNLKEILTSKNKILPRPRFYSYDMPPDLEILNKIKRPRKSIGAVFPIVEPDLLTEQTPLLGPVEEAVYVPRSKEFSPICFF